MLEILFMKDHSPEKNMKSQVNMNYPYGSKRCLKMNLDVYNISFMYVSYS